MSSITVRVAAEFADVLAQYDVTMQELQDIIAQPEKAQTIALAIRKLYSSVPVIERELTPIDKVSSNGRVASIFKRYGILYVEELATISDRDIRLMRDVGPVTLAAINGVIDEYGIKLVDSADDRRGAIQALYGLLVNAPLRLILLLERSQWYHDYKLTPLSISSVNDLLNHSRRELMELTYAAFGSSSNRPAFTPQEVRAIEVALERVGLHLREE